MVKRSAVVFLIMGLVLYAVVMPVGVVFLSDAQAWAQDQRAVYVCSQCGLEQAQGGTCPKCNVTLAASQMSYECPRCGVSQAEPGNCSICGVALQEKKKTSSE